MSSSSSAANQNNLVSAFNALSLGNANDEPDDVDSIVCKICERGDNEDTLLLCDGEDCSVSMHTGCLNMEMVPPGEWFCARCVRNGVNQTKHFPQKKDYIFLYERVSSKLQDAPEYGRAGMDTQNHELLKFCLERGITVRGTFTDVGSGRDVSNLQEFQKMTRRLPRGACVIVYSVSRFGRNISQVQQYLNALHDKGCYVYSVTENVSSFDRQFLNLVAQAQRESQQLSATIRASVQRRRREGQWIGPAPYGFEVCFDSQNRRRVQTISSENAGLHIFTNTFYSDNEVLESLAELNILPRTGTWTLSRVSNTRKRISEAFQNMNS